MPIVKLRFESGNRRSPSVEFANSLPHRWTRLKHASETRSGGLESRRVRTRAGTRAGSIPGTRSRVPIAVGAEIGRLAPRAPASQFTGRSCVARRDATRTGHPTGVPRERSFASFTPALNTYNSHIVYIEVLNEVSVIPARGAQS